MRLTFTHLFINGRGSRTSNSGMSLGVACCLSARQQINVSLYLKEKKKIDVILQFATHVSKVNMQKEAFECSYWYLDFQREVSINSKANLVSTKCLYFDVSDLKRRPWEGEK